LVHVHVVDAEARGERLAEDVDAGHRRC
jgi:hypothetical protein